MNILVTGGLGYIGSITCLHLCHQGYNPIIVDNLSNSTLDTLKRLEKIANQSFDFYQIDLDDRRACDELLNINFESIIHFAAKKSVEESNEYPITYYRNNLQSLINVLDISKIKNSKNFIFSSSCTVYGDTKEFPIDENTKMKAATSVYGHTKQVCEGVLEQVASKQDIKCISLRYFNPVGAYYNSEIGEYTSDDSRNILPLLDMAANKLSDEFIIFGGDYDTRDGTAIRDYIDVNDLALGHILALDFLIKSQEQRSYEIFNLGSGKGNTVKEIVSAYEQANEVQIETSISERRSGDLEKVYADIRKANEILQWYPRTELKDSLRSSYLWTKKLHKK